MFAPSLSGLDLIEGTPVLDIKPYHPADALPVTPSSQTGASLGPGEAWKSGTSSSLLKVPAWLAAGEQAGGLSVKWTTQAQKQVNCVHNWS